MVLGVALAIALVAGPRVAVMPVAAGTLVLHHHREDGRYAGLELVTSEAVSARTARQSSRPRALKPDGKDDFGVVWSIPTQPFADGKVGFGIRLPDGWDGWDECTMQRKVGEPLVEPRGRARGLAARTGVRAGHTAVGRITACDRPLAAPA